MMKNIATAAALLVLAGCNPAAAPAGGNQSANGATATSNGSGGQTTGNAVSAAPALDRAYLVGRWTDNGDCSNATEFAESGQFQTSGGAGGSWSLAGDRLTLAGGQTIVMQVVVIDQNTINIVNPDSSVGRSTRC